MEYFDTPNMPFSKDTVEKVIQIPLNDTLRRNMLGVLFALSDPENYNPDELDEEEIYQIITFYSGILLAFYDE